MRFCEYVTDKKYILMFTNYSTDTKAYIGNMYNITCLYSVG